MESLFDGLIFTASILLGLFILVLLVVLHELGHAIVARRNGVVVEEFGIGFPPRAWAKKLENKVLFTLNWLPLGGFVKLKGEHDADTAKGTYGAAKLWPKVKILMAGVAINWLTAVVIFTALALVGIPKVLPDQFNISSDATTTTGEIVVAAVTEGSAAEEAGLQTGDTLVSVAGETPERAEQVGEITRKNTGKEVEVVYERDGETITKTVTLGDGKDENKGVLGVAPGQREFIRSTWSAPIVGLMTTVQLTGATLDGLGDLLGNVGKGVVSQFSGNEETRQEGSEALGEANQGVAGPIGILGNLLPNAVLAGPVILLFLTGIISLTLAVMNALPIPALDGGRLFVTLAFRVTRQPLTKEREDKIHSTGFLVLIALIIFITILDVGKFF